MSELAEVIAAGGVAVIPTDTVYGICAGAVDEPPVRRLLGLKGRDADKPSAVAFASVERALGALPGLGERTRAAVRALLPGALTLLVPNPGGLFPLAGGELLGVRVFRTDLRWDAPILLTSANLAGAGEARTLAAVPASMRAGVDLAIDAGELPGTPSTVLDLGEYESYGRWRILREGACTYVTVQEALLASNADE